MKGGEGCLLPTVMSVPPVDHKCSEGKYSVSFVPGAQ